MELRMFIIRVSGKIGREIGCDSGNGEPLQVSWNRQFRNNLCVFIPKSMGFSQSKLRIPVSTGMLRISLKRETCDINCSPSAHLRVRRTLNPFLDKGLSGESSDVQTCDTVCKSLQNSLTGEVPQRPERIS